MDLDIDEFEIFPCELPDEPTVYGICLRKEFKTKEDARKYIKLLVVNLAHGP